MLKLLNVRGILYIDDALSYVAGTDSASVFDFYEDVIEYALHDLKSVHISLTNADSLRFSMNVRCNADLSPLAKMDNVLYENDGEYQQIVFFPKGGGTE